MAYTPLLKPPAGGTGTTTTFTSGSVVFSGASGVYSQDNANLFWDDTNNRLGVRTAAPTYALEVVPPANDGANVMVFSATAADRPLMTLTRGRGSISAPTALQSGDLIGDFGWAGSTAVGTLAGAAKIRSVASEAWTSGALGSDIRFLTVANGTVTPTERLVIGSAGEVAINTSPVPGVTLRVQAAGSNDIGWELQRLTSTNIAMLSYNRASSTYTALSQYASQHVWVTSAGPEAARIDASSNLLIGTTSNPNSVRLNVNGQAAASNFSDATGTYNVNLGSGGLEGRGLVAGYSGGSYGGIGYNIRHVAPTPPATGGTYTAPLADTATYLLFNQGFSFYNAPTGAAGRDVSSALALQMRLDPSGNLGIGTPSPAERLSVGASNEFTVTSIGVVRVQPSGSTENTVLTLSSSGGATGPVLELDANNTSGTVIRQYLGGSGAPTKGLQIDWSANYGVTNPSNWVMAEFKAPSITKTGSASASTYAVIDIPGVPTLTHSTTNTLTWYGARIQMPTVTKAAVGGTLNAYGLQINAGPFGSNYGTAVGLRVTAAGTGTATNVGLAGIELANITPGTSDSVGMQVGTGWSLGLYSQAPAWIVSDRAYTGVSCLILSPINTAAQPASTEIRDLVLTANTQLYNAGAIATQRSVHLESQSYSFTAASTITNAVTLDISPPKASTNATISNSYGVYVRSADVSVGSGAVTQAYGLRVDAPTGATEVGAATFSGLVTMFGNTPFNSGVGIFSTLSAFALPISNQPTPGSNGVIDFFFGYPGTSVLEYQPGAITDQFTTVMSGRTYAFTAASSTITNAATLRITGAPIAGTNAVITNQYSLWASDDVLVDGAVITPGDIRRQAKFIDDMVRGGAGGIDANEAWNIASTGTIGAGQGSSSTSTADKSYGVQSMSTGTAANSGVNYLLGLNSDIEFGNGRVLTRARIRFPALSSATQEYVFRFGIADSAGVQGPGSDYAVFEYDRATAGSDIWRTATGNDTFTSATNESGIAAQTWYELAVELLPTSVANFYINGTLVNTATGLSVPGASDEYTVMLQIYKTTGTAARSALVDYVYLQYLFNSAR